MCFNAIPYIEPNNTSGFSHAEAIKKVAADFPEAAKIMRMIGRKATITEIAYAGELSFYPDGKLCTSHAKGNFRYKIVYYYNDICEPDLRGYHKPKEFVWCFDEILTEQNDWEVK